MIAAAPCSLRNALLVLAGVLAGCTERDPLGTASVSISATGTESEGGNTGTSTGGGTPGTTSEGPPTTTTTSSSTTAVDTGDPVETDGGDLSGQFLLSVSTVIAPNLPLQFLAMSTQTVMDGQTWVSFQLHPLSLSQGQVTTPREPVGTPMIFNSVPVIDGVFEIDAGVVEIVGQANPITGGEIVASLFLKMGTVMSDDFYCGNVEGEVMMPLKAQLFGSTFAAVRVAGLADLPLDVTINCAGQTVTDP